MSATSDLTIREVSARTGVSQPTLRVWEERHHFPWPIRLPSGHRRYSVGDVDAILGVEADRRDGVSLKAAIGRARERRAPPEHSLFAGLRRRRPELDPFVLSKRTLIGMSYAMEDECAARADRAVLLATFQRESHYRSVENRWRELSQTAEMAVVFADFDGERRPEGGPSEVPFGPSDPLGREWSLVCEAADYSACLSGWEPPGQDDLAGLDRSFETVWSVEAGVVRDALELAVALTSRLAPSLADAGQRALERPVPRHRDEMRLATALTSRMLAYVGAGEPVRPYSTGGRPQLEG